MNKDRTRIINRLRQHAQTIRRQVEKGEKHPLMLRHAEGLEQRADDYENWR